MIWKFAPLALVGFVAACGGNPLNFDGPAVEPPPEVEPPEIDEPAPITGVQIPAVIAQNLRAASYSPNAATAASTLRIDLASLDGTPISAAYDRDPDFDLPGYEAFTIQESNSNRKFIALFKRADSAEAGVVGSGQFATFLGGATYRQLQPFTLPTPTSLGRTSLLATYNGGYVGLLNNGPDVVHPQDPFDPSMTRQVHGEFMMNADFNAGNMQVEGGVRNRTIRDPATHTDVGTLAPIFFKITQITPEGAFSGNVSYAVPGPDYDKALGHYSGVIGGQGTSVAGGTRFTPDITNDKLIEHGAFVGNACVTPGTSPSDGTTAPPCPTWYRN